MAVTEPVPRFMTWSLGVEGGGIYCRQVARGNLVLGGGSGVALDADRARSERSAIATLAVQAVELLPALKNAHFIRTWSGTEGYLPDRQPVLCKSSTTPGLVHGFGFAGAGFQIGPGVGQARIERQVVREIDEHLGHSRAHHDARPPSHLEGDDRRHGHTCSGKERGVRPVRLEPCRGDLGSEGVCEPDEQGEPGVAPPRPPLGHRHPHRPAPDTHH
eukprot:gene16967-biopygen9903